MSARRRLTITPDARQDIRDVLRYTRERWGTEQQRRYRAHLYEEMRKLVRFPELGQPRDDLFVGCRMLPVEQHIVFYRMVENDAVVGRVLHVRRNALSQVAP